LEINSNGKGTLVAAQLPVANIAARSADAA